MYKYIWFFLNWIHSTVLEDFLPPYLKTVILLFSTLKWEAAFSNLFFGLFQIAKFWEEFHFGLNCFHFGVVSFCVLFLNFLLSLFDKSEMFGQFIRSQCNKQVSRRTKTLKFSSRFGKSIFIVIYFTRYTSRGMERSDRLNWIRVEARSIYFKKVKYINFFIFIRIRRIDILVSSICAQKQLRMRMKLSLFYIVSYIFMMIFLTFTCCQHGISSSVSYSPSYICML